MHLLINTPAGRCFCKVDEKMQVLDKEGGEVVPNLYCIGDANGKLMLAHAASAHGVRYVPVAYTPRSSCLLLPLVRAANLPHLLRRPT